jgi:hypothetical protein
MQIRLSFKRMFLSAGKTLAVPTVSGTRVRVEDGLVWATTSGSPDDVWLGAGDEHTVQSAGLTVIESVARSRLEIIPPGARASNGTRGHVMNRYHTRVPRATCKLAAITMTALTIGLLVVLPARMASDPQEARQPVASSVVLATPLGSVVVTQNGSKVEMPGRTSTQATSGGAVNARSVLAPR